MGHCEMLLAVAGLDKSEITKRTRQLASGDWSEFDVADRAAFTFAKKMSQTPWELTGRDFLVLEKLFGRHRAVDVAWWSARCQYMTRVADAFQLPLERENVFQRPKNAAGDAKEIEKPASGKGP
jgi:hypothetical protein